MHLISTGSFSVLGRGRRQKIDQRSNEAKTFYVPTESRNCLYSCFDRRLNKGREILETHFGSLLRLGPTWNLSVLHITANAPHCLVDKNFGRESAFWSS